MQPHRETKSLVAEDTFAYDLTLPAEMIRELDKIAQTVYGRLQRYQLKGRTITVKIKYSDFKQITRSRSFPEPVDDLPTIARTAAGLLEATELENKKIRLLGISISNFEEGKTGQAPPSGQLELF